MRRPGHADSGIEGVITIIHRKPLAAVPAIYHRRFHR